MESTYRNASFATPALKQYDQKRQQYADEIKQYLVLFFAGLAVFFFSIIAHMNDWLSSFPYWMSLCIGAVSIGAVIYGGIQWGSKEKEFTKNVLVPAVTSILKGSGRDWNFLPHGETDDYFINQTHFFKSSPSSINGSILLRGNYHDYYFTLRDVTCHRGHGKHRKEMWSGLLLQIKKKNPSGGTIVVLPDSAQKILGTSFGKKMQSWNAHNGLSLVYFQDEIFEKNFVVYARDEEKCRTILSPKCLNVFKDLHNEHPNRVLVSIQSNSTTIGLAGVRILALSRKHNLNDKRTTDGIFRDVEMLERLMDDFLSLNN